MKYCGLVLWSCRYVREILPVCEDEGESEHSAERRLSDDSFIGASHAAGLKPVRQKPLEWLSYGGGGARWSVARSLERRQDSGSTSVPAQTGESPPPPITPKSLSAKIRLQKRVNRRW